MERGARRDVSARCPRRVLTAGVTPSLHIDYKHTGIKQYHKQGPALRTETTINDTRDFGIGKRLTSLPALREIGISANRRLLGVQRLSHNPIRAAEAFTAINDPLITHTGTRIPGLRFTDRRVHALLQTLLVFRLLPHGFANRDLRALLAPLLGLTPGNHHRRTDELRPAPPPRPRVNHPRPGQPPLPGHRHRTAPRDGFLAGWRSIGVEVGDQSTRDDPQPTGSKSRADR